MTPELGAYWEAFQAAAGVAGAPFDVSAFGDSPELADELLALVLSGRKRATCALARWFETRPLRPPRPGDLSLILDGSGAPACVIETTEVRIGPVSSVDDAFAYDEGEGDRTRASWLADHRAYFEREAAREGFVYSDALDAVFERFRVVWPVGAAD